MGPWLESALEAMRGRLRHRGPDDEGLWLSPGREAGLVHTRLSILDLSPAGHQPMTGRSGALTVVFNGEIYNFRELRAQLAAAGVVFHTATDTEVLLRLYEREGEAMVGRLRGMFAFCLWDAEKGRALLARDPLGIKPLYVHEDGGRLAFASELRALCGAGLFTPRLDAAGLRGFLETGSVPEPLTLAQGVRMLGAGETLLWEQGRSSRRRYWNLRFGSERPADAVERVRAALLDSVSHHFVSDVPVGLFLSGGMDSTALLALANAEGRQGVAAFSIGVDEAAADETGVARRTAGHFGADYHELRLDAGAAFELARGFLEAVDQPTIDGLNTYAVAGLARQHGMKVVLSGLGGDELFGGYASFSRIPRMRLLRGGLRWVPGVGALLGRRGPQGRRMADYVRSDGGVAAAHAALRGIFSQAEARALAAWVGGKAALAQEEMPPVGPHGEPGSPEGRVADEICRLETERYMRNQMLRDSDVLAMARGLELRTPFVDSVLVEAVTALHPALRLRSGKAMLAAAVPEIPRWVLEQRKRGFLFPFQRWLSGDADSAVARGVAAAVQGAPVPVPNWYQKWSLFMLRHCMEKLGLRAE